MHFNLINWLFQDPCTATGCYSGGPAEEKFHYYALWIIFCAVGVLISFYYSVEGRKRFTKNRPWLKYMLDRYLGWLAIICIIGGPLIFSRAYLDYYFFAWRVWRYLWVLSLVVWAALLVVHRFRTYPREREYYLAQRKKEQYMPRSSRRKATASR